MKLYYKNEFFSPKIEICKVLKIDLFILIVSRLEDIEEEIWETAIWFNKFSSYNFQIDHLIVLYYRTDMFNYYCLAIDISSLEEFEDKIKRFNTLKVFL